MTMGWLSGGRRVGVARLLAGGLPLHACGPTDGLPTKAQTAAADYETKQLALANAQQTLAAKQMTYEEAKKQESAGLREADNHVREAEGKLAELLAGPDPAELASAQAVYDRAMAALDKLRQPVKPAEGAEAQAEVDRARGVLDNLRRGTPAEEITVAQASLDQAQAALCELQAGPKASELARAQAAPFARVVAAVNGVAGQQTMSNTGHSAAALVALVDDSTLRIDIRVAESDVARVRLNPAARISWGQWPASRCWPAASAA